jgi:cardiolipin synthase
MAGIEQWITEIVYALDVIIRLGLAVRIIMRRRPVGVSLAWLMVLLFPLVGALAYLIFGELRLGSRRVDWAKNIHDSYERWLSGLRERSCVDWSQRGAECEPLARLVEATVGIPALQGNHLELLDTTEAVFARLIADIDAAERSCFLEFYIWNKGGLADEVAAALVRAAGRQVVCRVLVDSLGSRQFLRSSLVRQMRDAGVMVAAALPSGLVRGLFVRFDLRLHRKIVVIDGKTAYTGSLNLVDPRFFKQEAGVGQWVDAMVRLQGLAVEGLTATFLEDWELETQEGIAYLVKASGLQTLKATGDAVVQVTPSGPLLKNDAIQQIVLMAIYAARSEIVITTPYFVPGESLLLALVSAAQRGVQVTLVLPAKNDSRLVGLASQAFKGDLIQAGVRVALFDAGLLHTKSISVDGEFSFFGSLNLDPRSFFLNFEITLCVYDREFTEQLRALQQGYIEKSKWMELAAWQDRSLPQRFAENTARLLGPLL